ncbi:MAG: SGNH/GDSL hydrolase family protein [Clostridia bacterium]|nr:SGNH/GDSL hydrolase family protein [Clostridia bacterium]
MKKLITTLFIIIIACSALLPSAAAAANSAPQLLETSCLENEGAVVCLVQFKSVAGKKYRVYRRAPHSGKYTALGDIKAKGKTTQFKDKTAKKGSIYFYTVRTIIGKKNLSAFEKKGIKALCVDCAPTISLTTMSAKIRFTATPEATSYFIYRKFGNEAFKQIGTVTAAQAKVSPQFTDTYYQSLKSAAEKEYLISDTFVDPTANPFRYEVRAINKAGKQIARGYYSKTGTCVVGTPALSRVNIKGKNAEIIWAGVPVAKSYNIYAKVDKTAAWTKLAVVTHNSSDETQRKNIVLSKNYAYFTVRAFAQSHGKLISGNYEKDFSITNRNYSNKKALFLGDSIARGRPYKGQSLLQFSYPIRVQQLLGIQCDNIAITATTITEATGETERQSVLTDELEPMFEGRQPLTPASYLIGTTLSPLWQYDYIVLQGGTNDYGLGVPLGAADSSDTRTFNGALNRFKEIINITNDIRAENGLKPIKVVVLDITFSYRFGLQYTAINNRFTTPNKLGLNALAYNQVLHDNLSNSGLDVAFVESHEVLNEENCLYESADNLHFTKLGYGQLGKLVAEVMK